MTPPNPPRRKNNFDFLRCFFAVLVVFSHSYPLATGTEDHEPLALLTRGQFTFGSLAVDCFFIISGYLIAQSWTSRPDAIAFLNKRVRRIYPGFFAAAIICAFVLPATCSNGSAAPPTLDFVLRFFGNALRLIFTQPGGTFPTNPAPGTINGSLWSIPYEFWCYVLVLCLGMLGGLRSRPMTVTLFALSLGIAFIFVRFGLTPGGKLLGTIFGYPPFWARLLPYFLAGVVFYSCREFIALNRAGALVAALAIVLSFSTRYAPIFVVPIAMAYLIFWVAYIPSAALSSVARYGDVSYGLYLYSFPIEQIVVMLNGHAMRPINLFALALPVSACVAFLSWHLLEKHVVRSRPAATRRPSGIAATAPMIEVDPAKGSS